MTDKNEFRYIQKGDLLKVKPKELDERGLIRRILDTVKESIHEMVRSVDGITSGRESRREGDRKDTGE